jgi:hypothetical protein
MRLHDVSAGGWVLCGHGACVDLRDSQACKDAASQDERNGNAQVQDEAGISLGQLLVLERVHEAGAKGQRNGLDHGRKGMEEAYEQHVDAAIGTGPRAGSAGGRGHGDVEHLSAGRWRAFQRRRGRTR